MNDDSLKQSSPLKDVPSYALAVRVARHFTGGAVLPNQSKGVTVLEWPTPEVLPPVPRFYPDEEIVDIFGEDGTSLVIALLRRAQAAEAEIVRLQEVIATQKADKLRVLKENP